MTVLEALKYQASHGQITIDAALDRAYALGIVSPLHTGPNPTDEAERVEALRLHSRAAEIFLVLIDECYGQSPRVSAIRERLRALLGEYSRVMNELVEIATDESRQ